MSPAVIIEWERHEGLDGDKESFLVRAWGPFSDRDVACAWADKNLRAWSCEHLASPA